jgi:hypothetical protein
LAEAGGGPARGPFHDCLVITVPGSRRQVPRPRSSWIAGTMPTSVRIRGDRSAWGYGSFPNPALSPAAGAARLSA